MRHISFILDVVTIPEIVFHLATYYWCITAVVALLIVGAVIGIVIFTKKHKGDKK